VFKAFFTFQLRLRLFRKNSTPGCILKQFSYSDFPGKAGNLNTLHAGALGNGPRGLLTTTEAPFQTLLWTYF
ncbi:MAG: hypothetical protein AAFV85_18175, partial [Cyanobacteria bacterium J06634_6]